MTHRRCACILNELTNGKGCVRCFTSQQHGLSSALVPLLRVCGTWKGASAQKERTVLENARVLTLEPQCAAYLPSAVCLAIRKHSAEKNQCLFSWSASRSDTDSNPRTSLALLKVFGNFEFHRVTKLNMAGSACDSFESNTGNVTTLIRRGTPNRSFCLQQQDFLESLSLSDARYFVRGAIGMTTHLAQLSHVPPGLMEKQSGRRPLAQQC